MPYPVLPPALPPAIEISQVAESSNLGNPLFIPLAPSPASSDLLSAYSEAEETTTATVLSPLKSLEANESQPPLTAGIIASSFPPLTVNQAHLLGGALTISVSDDEYFASSSRVIEEGASPYSLTSVNPPEHDALQPTFADLPWTNAVVQNVLQSDSLPLPLPNLEAETDLKPLEPEDLEGDTLPSETNTIEAETDVEPLETEDPGKTALPSETNELIQNIEQTPQPTELEAGADFVNTLELTADQQEYDPERQVIIAQGNVVMQVANGLLDADQLWINLANRFAVAKGNVTLTRGEQILRGERVEYNFTQGQGTFFNASGDIFLPSLGSDISSPLPNDIAAQANLPISDRLTNQPVQNVRGTGGLTFGTGSISVPTGGGTPNFDPEAQGNVRRFRFEAARIEFDAEGWQAEDVRVTNDPFSPPELELRADTAQLRTISLTQDELLASNARLVFDQGFTLPLLRRRLLLNRGNVDDDDLNPLVTSFGIDGEDRGGAFVESTFKVVSSDRASVRITPQFLIERFNSTADRDPTDLSVYGLVADARTQLSPRTSIQGEVSLSSLELDDLENNTRLNVRGQQLVGDHTLTLAYSFRDRLFNGSLGFQDVQNSVGAVLTSPVIQVGGAGLNLSYQASAQYINAETDRDELLEPIRDNDRVSLGRFQASAALSQGLMLWQGKRLPPTATEGLRYTPNPVTPFLRLSAGLRGVATYYTNDDFQGTITGSISIAGQIGHFSRPYFDYTRFNLTYSQALLIGTESPFEFDRAKDRQVISAGIIQQIYGPIRAGFQTSLNLESDEEINTDLILEYSRRTYGLLFRFNPVQRIGFVGLRISDFVWTGSSPAFGGSGTRRVEGGVIR